MVSPSWRLRVGTLHLGDAGAMAGRAAADVEMLRLPLHTPSVKTCRVKLFRSKSESGSIQVADSSEAKWGRSKQRFA